MNLEYNENMLNLLNDSKEWFKKKKINLANNIMTDDNWILIQLNWNAWDFDSINMNNVAKSPKLNYETHYNSWRIDKYFFWYDASLFECVDMAFMIAWKWLFQLYWDYETKEFVFLIQYDEWFAEDDIPFGLFIKCMTRTDYKSYFNGKNIHDIDTPYISIEL